MKIALNARFLITPFTGIGVHTYEIINALTNLDLKNEYFLLVPQIPEWLKKMCFPSNFKIVALQEKKIPSASIRKTFWETIQIPHFLRTQKIDLYHSFYPTPARVACRYFVTLHDTIPWIDSTYRNKIRTKIYYYFVTKALKSAEKIITVSKFSQNEIINQLHLPKEKIQVIYNAASPEYLKVPQEKFIELNKKLNLQKPYFCYVGGFDTRKNISTLAEAYRLLNLELSKTTDKQQQFDIPNLVLVGGENFLQKINFKNWFKDDKNPKLLYNKNGKGKIILTPSLENSELNLLYRNAKAFVNFSTYEGFNLPLLEALTTGIPAIVSDLSVHREITEENAYFIKDFQNPQKLAIAWKKIILALTSSTSAKKQQQIKHAHKFSWNKSAKMLLQEWTN